MNGQSGTPSGAMIVVVGPSGAGKDSVIDFARQRLADNDKIAFVRRYITRDAAAGSEDHHAVTPDAFERMQQAGRFALHWAAHGLRYGIPAETQAELAAGRTLIANGSRAALPEFQTIYPKLLVVTVTASPHIIAERLKNRGREDEGSISRRLARSEQQWAIDCQQVIIDNGGALETAGAEFVDVILRMAKSDIVENA